MFIAQSLINYTYLKVVNSNQFFVFNLPMNTKSENIKENEKRKQNMFVFVFFKNLSWRIPLFINKIRLYGKLNISK